MKEKKRNGHPMPRTIPEWLAEIGEAFEDAREAIPFGVFVGKRITERDLFHMAAMVCLKFRGMERSEVNLDRATKAMLTSYVATESNTPGVFDDPVVAFGFCYLASHFGLDLLAIGEVSRIMDKLAGPPPARQGGKGKPRKIGNRQSDNSGNGK